GGTAPARAEDECFDYSSRKHLQTTSPLVGATPPMELSRPICKRVQRPLHTTPTSFLDIKIDGRLTFFEWINAGCYQAHNERGTMGQATPGSIHEVYFGFDPKRLLVRVDVDGRAREALLEFTAVRVGFVEPAGWDVVVTWQPGGAA